MRKIYLIIFFFLLFFSFSKAQEKKEGAPITVEISSKFLAPEQSYELSGQTETGNKSLNVKIEILSASSVLETENVKTDATGKYKINRKAPTKKGIYKAIATSADTKISDTITFVVANPIGIGNALANHIDAPVKFAQKSLETSAEIVKSLPYSAAKEDFLEKCDEITQGLTELEEQSNDIKEDFIKLIEITAKDPKVWAAVDPYIDELSDEIEKTKEQADRFQNRISQQNESNTSPCDQLNAIIEVIEFASLMLNFQGHITDIIMNLTSSKVIAGSVNRLLPDNDNLAFGINAAQGALFSKVTTFKKLLLHVSGPGFMLDLASFIGKKVYKIFCEEMKGPFTGKFVAEFDAGVDKGMWEKYSMDMKGNLTLRYVKGGSSKTGFTVTGEFEGLYTDYSFWSDVEKVEPLPKNIYLLMNKVVLPPTIDYSAIGDDLGLIARQMIPGSFCIKVKGKIKDKDLTLAIDKEALINSTNLGLSTRQIIVGINPALPIPLVTVFKYPMAPARSIFTVGLGDSVKFELKRKGSQTYAKKQLNNNKDISNKEIRLKTQLDISIETEEEK